ncbi:transglutaminase-like domain-containing protein [Angustibacter peucedani]
MSTTTGGIPAAVPPPPSHLTGSTPGARERLGAALQQLRPGTDQLVDGAAALVLVLVAAVGFRTSFYGPRWAVAAVLGALLGLAIAHVARTFALPVVVGAVAVVAAYFLLGGPMAVRDHLALGVFPTSRTLGDLAHAAVPGWKDLLTTLAPVDATGRLVALPFAFALVGTAATYGVARRWRSPGLALVPPLALLVLSIALGTVQPAATWLQGSGFALVAVLWLVARTARLRSRLQSGTARTTRAGIAVGLLAVSVAVGVLAGPALESRSGHARTVWRTDLQPPFDVAQLPSPLAGFRRYTEPNQADLFDKTLLTVQGLPSGVPLRIATLDSFDGSVWGAAGNGEVGTAEPGAAFRRVGSHLATTARGRDVTVTVQVPAGGYTDVWLPTVGSVSALSFGGPRAEQLRDELRFNVDTDSGVLPGRIGPGDSYTLQAVVPDDTTTELPAELDAGSAGSVDTDSVAFVDDKLDGWTGDEQDPYRQLVATARYMRSEGAYTDGGPPGSAQNVYLPGHSIGRLARFVGSSQLAGDDEQYAATLALVANRLGLPARVVLGAIPEGDGQVKGKDVHAWVELNRSDGSWLAVLPQAFVPDRNKVPDVQQLRSQQQQVGAQVPPPAAQNPPSLLQGPEQAQNDTRSKRSKHNPLDPRGWPSWLLRLVLFVVVPVLVVLGVHLLLVALKRRQRRRRRTTGPPSTRVAAGWQDVLDTSRELGRPVHRKATRREQVPQLVGAPDDVGRLATTADASVFGPGEPTDAEVIAYWADVDSVRDALRQDAGRWRSLRADWDVRTLRRDRSRDTRKATRR